MQEEPNGQGMTAQHDDADFKGGAGMVVHPNMAWPQFVTGSLAYGSNFMSLPVNGTCRLYLMHVKAAEPLEAVGMKHAAKIFLK